MFFLRNARERINNNHLTLIFHVGILSKSLTLLLKLFFLYKRKTVYKFLEKNNF